MVVQCPNCQSKFRIADEKVTDRGVRVRCTACKNVFQVKKSGAAAELKNASQGVTGTTQEMQALDPALLGKPPAAAPAAPRAASPGARPAARPAHAPLGAGAPRKVPPVVAAPHRVAPPATHSARGAAGAVRPPAPMVSRPPSPRPAAAAGNGARRLQADDLFGMSELTGDSAAMPGSPLSSQTQMPAIARPPTRPGAPPRAPGAVARAPGKPPALPPRAPPPPDDFDVDVNDAPSLAPPQRPGVPPPPPPPAADESAPEPPPPPADDDMPTPPAGFESDGSDARPTSDPNGVRIGAFKTSLRDPFEGVDFGGQESTGAGSIELANDKKPGDKAKGDSRSDPPRVTSANRLDPIQPRSARREVVSSMLTGLVGAALALALVLSAAFSEENASGWLGLSGGNDIVATKIVSGLYDTASGRPVFFIRGRIENHGTKVRGPVRVIAELVSADSGAEARAESLAGAEPTPEEVFALRTSTEVEKLNRVLTRNDGERRIPPGGSLPFFALIAEPPHDLQRHKLHVRVEPVDAWSGPPRSADKADSAAKPAAPAKAIGGPASKPESARPAKGSDAPRAEAPR